MSPIVDLEIVNQVPAQTGLSKKVSLPLRSVPVNVPYQLIHLLPSHELTRSSLRTIRRTL